MSNRPGRKNNKVKAVEKAKPAVVEKVKPSAAKKVKAATKKKNVPDELLRESIKENLIEQKKIEVSTLLNNSVYTVCFFTFI